MVGWFLKLFFFFFASHAGHALGTPSAQSRGLPTLPVDRQAPLRCLSRASTSRLLCYCGFPSRWIWFHILFPAPSLARHPLRPSTATQSAAFDGKPSLICCPGPAVGGFYSYLIRSTSYRVLSYRSTSDDPRQNLGIRFFLFPLLLGACM